MKGGSVRKKYDTFISILGRGGSIKRENLITQQRCIWAIALCLEECNCRNVAEVF
jgi:hypothetical protein